MNFDELVNTKFNGDKEAALKQLAHEGYNRIYNLTKDYEEFKGMLDSMDTQTADRYMYYWKVEYNANPAIYDELKEAAQALNSLNLTYDDVKDAPVNPYKAKLGRSFLKALIAAGGMLGFCTLATSLGQQDLVSNLGSGLAAVLGSYVSLDIGVNLFKYKKYKKAKKYVEKNEERLMNQEMGGKTL